MIERFIPSFIPSLQVNSSVSFMQLRKCGLLKLFSIFADGNMMVQISWDNNEFVIGGCRKGDEKSTRFSASSSLTKENTFPPPDDEKNSDKQTPIAEPVVGAADVCFTDYYSYTDEFPALEQ